MRGQFFMVKKPLEKIIRYIFIGMLIVLLVFFCYYRGNLPSERFTEGTKCELLTGDWYRVFEDGRRVPVEVPGKCDIEPGKEAVVTTILPDDVYDEAVLCFRTSKQDMTILVDGEVRKTYSTKDSRVMGRNSVSVYLFVELSAEDSGKELTVHFATDSSYAGVMRPVYYGEVFGIWYKLIEENALLLVVSFILMILAVVTVVASNVMEIRAKKTVYLEYLGWGVLMIACWLIFQSQLRQLYLRNISLAGDMAHFCLMLIGLPISIFINNTQKYRYNRFYAAVSVASIVNVVVCTVLMCCNIFEYAELQYINLAIYGVMIVGIIVTTVIEWRKGFINEYKKIAYGFIGLVAAAALQILMSFRTDVVFSGEFLGIGVTFLLVMAIVQSIQEFVRREKEDEELKEEVVQKNLKVEKLTYQAMMTLAQTIDAKDTYTKGHSTRVAEYSRMIAKRRGMSEQEQAEIYFMGLLHDIGKIGIRDEIINKPGRLTDEEFAVIKSHPAIGFDILKNMTEIQHIEYGARWHHERYDGKGYPDGKKGDEIPEFARIIAIADAYDAMSSSRSYRAAMLQEKVRAEIEAGMGTQFDPELAKIMLELIDEDVNYDMRQKEEIGYEKQ